MRVVTSVCVAATLVVSAGIAHAESLKSGPQVGDEVGAFDVVKVAGATDDGVKVGDELCYRCKLGARPTVMVFARKADAALAKLVKELDTVVAHNKDKKFSSFVTLLGADADKLKADGEKVVSDSKAENVAVVVAKDHNDGPADYKIDPKAEVTVLIYREGKVEANHALSEGGLTDSEIKKIIADTSKIIN